MVEHGMGVIINLLTVSSISTYTKKKDFPPRSL